MDEIDRRLLRTLEINPRASFQELALSIGISGPSIQKRVNELERSGRIERYAATLHPNAFGADIAIVQGKCHGLLTKTMVRTISNHGWVRSLGFGAMNQVVALTLRRSGAELAELMSIMSEKCGIEGLEAFLIGESYFLGKQVRQRYMSDQIQTTSPKLKKIDYRIILALQVNARKSYSDISREIGVNAKTVRRRLKRMVDERLIEFMVLKAPKADQDIYFYANIVLRSRSRRATFFDKLQSDFSDQLDKVAFSDNPPKVVFVDGIAQTVDDLNSTIERLSELQEVEVVTPNVFLKGYYFATKLDRMVPELAGVTEMGTPGAMRR